MAKFQFTLEDAAGTPITGDLVQVKDGSSTVVASTADLSLIDNGDGTYETSTDLSTGEYSVFLDSTLVPVLDEVAHVDPDDTPDLPIGVIYGGTGATNITQARDNLGLTIGTLVQPYSSILDQMSTFSGDEVTRLSTLLDNAPNSYVRFATMTTTNFWTVFYTSSVRATLGLGTAAVNSITSTGEDGKIVQIADNSVTVPTRSIDLTSISGNVCKMYIKATGTASSSTWGLYIIAQSSNSGIYSYAPQALVLASQDTTIYGYNFPKKGVV
jgi:hypothetical protein